MRTRHASGGRTVEALGAFAVLLVALACGSPAAGPDGGALDGGLDAGAGGGDGGLTDGAVDAGDAGSDAGADAGSDASIDGGADAGSSDAGADAGVGPLGCITSISSGHHAFSCSGITYEVEIPPACTSGGCGVVFDIHGLTMNGDTQDKSTGLRAVGGALGYVIVQPTAPSSMIGPSWTVGTDDTKVWATLQLLRQALAIDPRRIHFTGFSQGGAMTWRLVCAHADVIASAAPIAAADGTSLTGSTPPFALDCPFTAGARPSQEVPLLQMHGITDGLVPIAKGRQQRDAVVSAWSLGAPTSVSTDAHHAWSRYVSPAGAVFEYLEHDYEVTPPILIVPLNGHCIPGGNDLRANAGFGQTMFFSCAPPNAFVWGQVVMQFFVAHPR